METMKAVVVTGENEYGVENILLDPPRADEIRMKMKAVGLCRSDLSVITRTVPIPLPALIGHEGAGVIVEVGEDVTRFQVGDHAVLSLVPVCGQCSACLNQRPNFCHQGSLDVLLQGLLPDRTSRQKRPDGEQLRALGALGCMAEETVVKETFAVKIDAAIPFDRACLVGCGVITGAAGAINAGQVKPGHRVAVFGCGGVGLSAIQGARIAGANMIIGVDRADNKLEWAGKLGATHTINREKENAIEKIMELTGEGADISLECAGVPELMAEAYNAVRQGGIAVVLGIPPSQESMPIDPFSFALFGKTLRGSKYGSSNPMADIPMLLDHYLKGNLDLDTMVSRTYVIDEIERAFEDMEQNINARGVILFD